MTANEVTLSGDRMQMTIHGNGRRATLHSALPSGFTPEHVDLARSFALDSDMIQGQINRARLIKVADRPLLLHVNTGPPTWWWPRLIIKKGQIVIGWLRVMVGVSWKP